MTAGPPAGRRYWPTEKTLEVLVDIAAMAGVVALAVYAGADPSVSVGAVAGLGGYRMRKRGAGDGE